MTRLSFNSKYYHTVLQIKAGAIKALFSLKSLQCTGLEVKHSTRISLKTHTNIKAARQQSIHLSLALNRS